MINTLLPILNIAKACTSKLAYEPTDNRKIYSVALYGSVLEFSHSIVILIHGKSPWGTFTILRSIFEAYVDLCNLGNDENFYKNLELKNFIEGKKLQEQYSKNPKNRFLPTYLQSNYIDYDALIKKYEEDGIKDLNIFERADECGMANEYRTVYFILCQESHSGLSALIGRNFNVSQSKEIQGIEFFKDKNSNLAVVDLLARILVASMEIMQKILSVDIAEEINQATKLLEKYKTMV